MTKHTATKEQRVLQMRAFYDKLPRNEKTGRVTYAAMAVWRQWLQPYGISHDRAKQLMKEAENPPAPKISPKTEQKYIAYLQARGYTVSKE